MDNIKMTQSHSVQMKLTHLNWPVPQYTMLNQISESETQTLK